ncbi:MAG TPA: DoxX family protein [Steroidobacteraceae bacterium]
MCTAFYLFPRTSLLGAVLLTGYLGGAIASKVRIHAPMFDIGFAIVFAVFVWGGLWLRNPRLRRMLPLQP